MDTTIMVGHMKKTQLHKCRDGKYVAKIPSTWCMGGPLPYTPSLNSHPTNAIDKLLVGPVVPRAPNEPHILGRAIHLGEPRWARPKH